MEGSAAINRNHQALLRILAALVAMAAVSEAKTIRRSVRLAVLRLLRPAEAAARRLIIAFAR